jgi:hypothetical protein
MHESQQLEQQMQSVVELQQFTIGEQQAGRHMQSCLGVLHTSIFYKIKI